MQEPNDQQLNIKLQIGFPKCSEDHRLQLVSINGSIFAILHAPLESDGEIQLLCNDWSLVLLAPIKSKTNIHISAINVICLNEIESKEGTVSIQALHHLIKLTPPTKPSEKVVETAKQMLFQVDDSAALFTAFQLFNKIVQNVRLRMQESLDNAKLNFITALCLLAEKCIGKTTQLHLKPVLNFWDIIDITQF